MKRMRDDMFFQSPCETNGLPPQTRRLLREALGSAGVQAPCWGAGLSLALHRLPLLRQLRLLTHQPPRHTESGTEAACTPPPQVNTQAS